MSAVIKQLLLFDNLIILPKCNQFSKGICLGIVEDINPNTGKYYLSCKPCRDNQNERRKISNKARKFKGFSRKFIFNRWYCSECNKPIHWRHATGPRKYCVHCGELHANYQKFINQAKQRGIPNTVSFDRWYEVKAGGCELAGIPNDPCHNNRHSSEDLLITIDRLDNGVYADDTIIGLCEHHNRVKNDETMETRYRIIEIYERLQ